MMNGSLYFIRIAIVIAIMLLAIFLIKKRRRLVLMIVLTTIVLLVLSLLLPVEHFVRRFRTPEDAYCYSHLDNDIIDVLYGEESALILSREQGGSYSVWLTQKDTNGYVIPVFGSVDTVQSNATIQIVRLKNTNDYYYYGLVEEKEGLSSLSDDIVSYTLPSALEGYVFCYGYRGRQ